MDNITRNSSFRALGQAPARAPQADLQAGPAELKGSNCPWTTGCQKVRGSNPNQQFQISVILKSPNDVQVSSSPFRSAAFDSKRSNATAGQIGDVEKFAKANGLQIASVDPETRTVKLQGTSAQYQKAFGVQLNEYKPKDGPQFRSYDGNVKLPASMAGNVQAVLGLDNHPLAHTNFVKGQPHLAGGGYDPTDVAKMYNFPTSTAGTGQTVAIIELGGGYKDAEVAQYFKDLGIKNPVNVTAVGVDGATNAPDGQGANGPDGEVDLDVEVVGAVAPKANIKVYFAPNTDQGFVDAVAQAAKDGANVESISWGQSESGWSAQALSAFDSATKDAAAKGVNIYAASGDNGSKDGQQDNLNHADYPSADPFVIGTGGTQLNGSGGKATSEVAWNDGFFGGAGGGGVSNSFPLPDFQKGAGVPAPTVAGGGRGVPDVSGDASPATGYNIMTDGSALSIGGTSAVAPLYAGLTALLGEGVGSGAQLGYLNPFFYAHPGDFNDITSGNNGGFQAGPGWDAVTGLGSPDGSKLLADLKAAHPAPTHA